MCVIAIQDANKTIPDTILQKCWRDNPDGAGFMYTDGSKVVIRKGYMNFDSFLLGVERAIIPKESPVIYHFRIGTHGSQDATMTHPFPISNNASDLKMSLIKSDIGLVHNGIINKMGQHPHLSDTALFVKTILANPLISNNLGSDVIKKLIENYIESSKLCFLYSNKQVLTYGDFVEEEGFRFSNDYWKFEGRYAMSTYYDAYYDAEYYGHMSRGHNDFKPSSGTYSFEKKRYGFERYYGTKCSNCGCHWYTCECWDIAQDMIQTCEVDTDFIRALPNGKTKEQLRFFMGMPSTYEEIKK